METNQTTAQPASVPVSNTGIFGTRIPSSAAFIVGILLFLTPFLDIKCNNTSLQQVSGFELATGFTLNKSNGLSKSIMEDGTNTNTKSEKKEPNMYALAALALGILGLLLSIPNAKAALGGAMVTGILSAGALIGLMIDIKNKVKLQMPDLNSKTDNDTFNLRDMNMKISVDFTPWFYIAVVAFLAAAFFCYKRMQTIRS
jgi:hypothetical protein